MVNLVSILEGANNRERVGPVEKAITDILYYLSDLIVKPNAQEDDGIIEAYSHGLSEFKQGYLDGSRPNAVMNKNETTPYNYGHAIGYGARSDLKEAFQDVHQVEIQTIRKFFEGMNHVMSTLDNELNILKHYATGQLMEQIASSNSPYNVLKGKLTDLLDSYRPLMEMLMSDNLQEGLVEGLEVSDQQTIERHTILGIVYMFRNEEDRARGSFNEAREIAQFTDYQNPVNQVALKPIESTLIFQEAYTKVKNRMDVNAQKMESTS